MAEKKAEDLSHCSILSSMCTLPHPIAVRAHMQFLETNLGDPGLFPGTAEIERRLVALFGALYHLPGAAGYASSGGTESNIQALRIAKARRSVERPNVVVPASSHFSFEKACRMLGLEMRTAPLGADLRMDPEAAGALVDAATVGLVGVVGTTEYGMVDPIPALARLAEEHDLFFHVDAAFGGLVVPFLPDPAPFDFALPGVSSIAVDPHKMGMSTIPAGCLLVREQEVLDLLNVETPYLTVKREYTLRRDAPGRARGRGLGGPRAPRAGGDARGRGGLHGEYAAADRGARGVRHRAGGDPRRQRRDLPDGVGAAGLAGLVHPPGRHADRLHAPRDRGRDRTVPGRRGGAVCMSG